MAHTVKSVQKTPIIIEQAWEFYSNSANLQFFTPGNMNFKVIPRYHDGDRLYAGQIFE